MDQFSKIFRERRIKNNYSQKEIAKKLNVSRSTISNWESGRNYPDLKTLVNISLIFKLSIDDLLKGDNKMLHKISLEKYKKNILITAIVILLILVTTLSYLFWSQQQYVIGKNNLIINKISITKVQKSSYINTQSNKKIDLPEDLELKIRYTSNSKFKSLISNSIILPARDIYPDDIFIKIMGHNSLFPSEKIDTVKVQSFNNLSKIAKQITKKEYTNIGKNIYIVNDNNYKNDLSDLKKHSSLLISKNVIARLDR